MYQAREPRTPMEWQQENRERKYAEQDRREWQARFEESPTTERTDNEKDRPNSGLRQVPDAGTD